MDKVEKFLKVKSIEFLHDDVEFGGNQAYFRTILEECEELVKTELIHSMNIVLAETFEKLKIIDKRRIPNNCFRGGPMQTKLTTHNKYTSKILMNKKYWKEMGFKDNDKISISKLEDGKVLIEIIGDDEKCWKDEVKQ